MTKKQLIARASHVNSDSNMSFYISTFDNVADAEIAAVLCSWASNGVRDEEKPMQYLFLDTIGSNPQAFVLEYPRTRRFIAHGVKTFYGALTYSMLDVLCLSLSSILSQYGSLRNCYDANVSTRQCRFSHEAFALAIGDACGFSTINSNSPFYRYNLLFYWLAYKLRIWRDIDCSLALLPCNDRVRNCAYELGIVKHKMKANLTNTTILTDKARDWFGDEDFFKMYELLNFYE